MAARFQIRTQLLVVVDLAVANEQDGLVGVEQRLTTAFQVDDGQSAMAQDGVRIELHAFAVGATVAQRVQHGLHAAHENRAVAYDSGNSTHAIDAPAARRCAASNTRSYRLRATLDEKILDPCRDCGGPRLYNAREPSRSAFTASLNAFWSFN